jgi:hypothetical protein
MVVLGCFFEIKGHGPLGVKGSTIFNKLFIDIGLVSQYYHLCKL